VTEVLKTDHETIPEPTAEPEAEMPLPTDPAMIFLGGLFVLALLAAAYVAGEIVLPLIFAFTLKLLLQPIMRFAERIHIPAALAALLLILLLGAAFVGVATAVAGPAQDWAGKLPEGLPRLAERLSFLRAPIAKMQEFLHQINGLGGAPAGQGTPAPFDGGAVLSMLFSGTRSFASGLFTTVLFLYFLLASGDTFLRRLVEVLPNFGSKRQAIVISQEIESDITSYLITITIMNALVGLATGAVMWVTGVGDPVLWGTVAFILNYAPILGPSFGVILFVFVGLLTPGGTWQAFLPGALYLCIHLVEGEVGTPMLLARRFTLNPVLVILSFAFWFWMWGIRGAILSMPMLAMAKIVCDRVRPLAALGHFLEG